MKMIIVGGGFLGQLLHTVWPKARVFDWRPKAPPVPARQLGPQYLWEPIRGLENRKFQVYTTVDGREATDESIRAYKRKVEKEQDASDWRVQFRHTMDGYECTLPPDPVEYGMRITVIDTIHKILSMSNGTNIPYDVLISTIPLDSMMQLCGARPELKSRPIYLYTSPTTPLIENDDMHVNYISVPHTSVYRQTVRDGKIHTESLEPFDPSIRAVKLMPGKIYDHPDVPKMIRALEDLSIFCLGRFGAWAPDELAHETYAKAVELSEDL